MVDSGRVVIGSALLQLFLLQAPNPLLLSNLSTLQPKPILYRSYQVENSDVTVGVFTLIGALFGALIAGGFSFLVTDRTLKHQEFVWQREIRLSELKKRRAEIELLIIDLGELEPLREADGNIKFTVGSSPSSRSAFYRLIAWQVKQEREFDDQRARGELAVTLFQLEFEREHITKQINQVIEQLSER